MKKTARLGICVAGALVGATTAGLPLTLASAADGDWVKPSTAPLLDAAGNDSGCVAGSPKMWVRQDSHGEWVEGAGTNMLCDRAYDRMVVMTGMWEIMPDGTQVVVYPFSERVRGSGPEAGVPVAVRTSRPCSAFPGTHAFLTRSKWKVKETKESTNPYDATVERVSTVTCPS